MKYSNDKYFSCYSPNLKEYLVSNGFEVKSQFVNVHTSKTCWIFDRTDSLSVYLTQWTKNKSNINILD
jgi:hypothetical protein